MMIKVVANADETFNCENFKREVRGKEKKACDSMAWSQ